MTNTEPWTAVRNAYREGKESLRSLARQYGIPESTLRARAAREHWERRSAEQEPLAAARSCVDRLLTAVQEALTRETALQSTRQVKCKCKEDGMDRNWTEEEPTGELDVGKVKEFTAVLDGLISLKRDLYDLPNGAEAERRQLAKEKLEMAKQKLTPPEQLPLQVLFSEDAENWSV